MACKIYTVYIYMYKTCFLVKGEHSVHTHTHTHTHIVALHLLYKPHTQQCAQTQSLVTFNTKISGQTLLEKLSME